MFSVFRYIDENEFSFSLLFDLEQLVSQKFSRIQTVISDGFQIM